MCPEQLHGQSIDGSIYLLHEDVIHGNFVYFISLSYSSTFKILSTMILFGKSKDLLMYAKQDVSKYSINQ